MDLARHLSILWKYRWVTLGGTLLGLALAFMAAYDVAKLPTLERRGSEEWNAESRIMVTQAGFPEGRVTLPYDAPEGGVVPVEPTRTKNGKKLKFAPPQRFSDLALLYSVIAIGDEVRAKLPGRPAPEQIQAEAIDATGNRTQYLPVIRLVTTETSAGAAMKLNVHTTEALKGLLEAQQAANDIPPSERIRLTTVNSPRASLVSGPSIVGPVMALLLCMLATLALVHVLESLWLRRTAVALQGVREIPLPPAPAADLPPAAGSNRPTG